MKKVLLLFALILSSGLIGSAFLDSFTARSDGNQIQLNWTTSNETNLRSFAIERKTVNGTFVQVSEIAAKGSNSNYSYIDDNIYKTTAYIYVYRLRIIDNNDNYTYSKELSVSHSLSDIKRTWGSIKAMFR